MHNSYFLHILYNWLYNNSSNNVSSGHLPREWECCRTYSTVTCCDNGVINGYTFPGFEWQITKINSGFGTTISKYYHKDDAALWFFQSPTFSFNTQEGEGGYDWEEIIDLFHNECWPHDCMPNTQPLINDIWHAYHE